MNFVRFLLFPISVIYGIITWCRNQLFNYGIIKSITFNVPVISVGNIKVGGTGKTPHIEYLIRLLKDNYNVATLSRGYGRKTKGFILSDTDSLASQIGDEPRQFKQKFQDIIVAVVGKRVQGIKKILEQKPETQVILLDDAFQHRRVKPKLSIILEEFSSFNEIDFMLPTGNLREYKSNRKRADIIIISKSPKSLAPIERREILHKIHLLSNQTIYFSYLKFGTPIPLYNNLPEIALKGDITYRRKTAVIVTGIVNPTPLVDYIDSKGFTIEQMIFDDHYQYSITDILHIQKLFDSIAGEKYIFTTEKDAMRLSEPRIFEFAKTLPIYYIPIEVDFNEQDKNQFNKQILDTCLN